MAVARMRTIPKAMEELKKADPETAVTKWALEKWIKSGELPHVKSGAYTLINMDNLYAFLEGKLNPAEPEEV